MRKLPHSDDGMVTAEAAVVLPSLLLVLLLAMVVVLTVGAKLKVVDAAREAARVAARGDGDAAAVQAARRLSPADPTIRVQHSGKWVVVTVRAAVRPFGFVPGLEVSAGTMVLSEQP